MYFLFMLSSCFILYFNLYFSITIDSLLFFSSMNISYEEYRVIEAYSNADEMIKNKVKTLLEL